MAPTRIQFERILCPVDFSPYATRALERAVRLGNWFDARVLALHVMPFVAPAGAGLPYFPAPPGVTREQREEAARNLQDLVEPFRVERVPIDTKVLEGDPWRVILEEAQSLPADLMVLGTHGRSGFEHLLLGSTTEKVLRRASCPVLTVGSKVEPPSARGPLFRRILCSADLTGASERTLDMALSLAGENDARITLLHVVESLPGETGGRLYLAVPEIGPLRRDIVDQARTELRAAVPDEARVFCEVTERVETGTAWREILRVAEETDADLIVMGAHAHGPLRRMFFGSTSSHVVRQAACPVLVIRERTPARPAQETREAVGAAAGSSQGEKP